MIKVHKTKIYPNATMTKVLNDLFSYRRFVWNQGLEVWNDMYDSSVVMGDKTLRPNASKVRNELVANKADWQYELSARVLQETTIDLGEAWDNYFNPKMPNHDRPRFKSRKKSKNAFTTDRAKVVNGKLRLDKPRGTQAWYDIRIAETPRFIGELRKATIFEEVDGYYVSLIIKTEVEVLMPHTNKVGGVDVNIKHFNSQLGEVNTLPDQLLKLYSRITHYQQLLARKRTSNPNHFNSNNYRKTRAKLKRDYQKVARVQEDLLQKFTTNMVKGFDVIGIEDLNVQGMKMNKRLAKNLQRGMFGKFAEVMKYKCEWSGKELVIVDRLFPSTQTCSECGFVKTKDSVGGKQTLSGDAIHHNHQKYYCYKCGAVLDRDENAVQNITNYAGGLHPKAIA